MGTNLVSRITERLERDVTNIKDSLNLSPKDLSWKIRWRMKHDRNPLFIIVQDKYRVKEYAQEKGVKSAEVYYATDKPETIPFDSLPDSFFIKANHGCKWNILCKNRELFYYGDGEDFIGRKVTQKYKLTREECIEYCKSWLNSTYSKKEWAYQHIVPKIIVEETLENYDGGELVDYRCFTFHGKVKAIYLDSATYSINHQKVFVDANWQPLQFKNTRELSPVVFPERPSNFQEVVEAAEKLGSELDFVRVDLYNTTKGVVVGEMSLYPMAGVSGSPTPDAKFNMWLGEQWKLPA